MGPSPIFCIIHTVTIGTMFNFDISNSSHGLKNVTCNTMQEHQTIPTNATVSKDSDTISISVIMAHLSAKNYIIIHMTVHFLVTF